MPEVYKKGHMTKTRKLHGSFLREELRLCFNWAVKRDGQRQVMKERSRVGIQRRITASNSRTVAIKPLPYQRK